MTAFSMLALGAISARAVWIGGAEHDTLSKRALNENTKPIPLLAARGTILSSNGQALAQDRPATRIAVDPKVVKNAARVAALIAPPLHQSVGQVQAALAKISRNEILEPFATPSVATQIREIKRNQLVDGAVIDGVDLTDVLQRVDPHGRVGSQVVGLARPAQKEDKTAADKVGISGLEARYNRELTGTSGLQLEARDPAGRTIRTISTKPAVPGKTLRTSIDPGIQLTLQDVLDRTVAANGAKSASAIVMRPSDGAILAIASNPGFDPNNRAGMTNEATNVGPVTEVFEPGSVFKLVAVAGAIQDGVVTPSTVYRGLQASETLYDYTVGESHRTQTQDMSVAEIIRTSSNIGTGHIAKDLGRDRFLAWTHRFGFGAQTGVATNSAWLASTPRACKAANTFFTGTGRRFKIWQRDEMVGKTVSTLGAIKIITTEGFGSSNVFKMAFLPLSVTKCASFKTATRWRPSTGASESACNKSRMVSTLIERVAPSPSASNQFKSGCLRSFTSWAERAGSLALRESNNAAAALANVLLPMAGGPTKRCDCAN